jgi:YD repeat-containing protein
VTSKGQTVGTVTRTVGYGYTNGNLTSMTTPSGQSVVYGYNSNHQITSVSEPHREFRRPLRVTQAAMA